MSGIIDLTSDDDAVSNRPPTSNNDVSDEEDEDLKVAIALSLQDQTDIEEAAKTEVRPNDPPQVIPERTKSSSDQTGLLGLDRKAMEAERLARLKRKREPDTGPKQPAQSPKERFDPATRISPPPLRRQKPNPTKSESSFIPTSTPPLPQPSPTTNPPTIFSTPQILLTSYPSRLTSIKPPRYASISLPDILLPPSPLHTLKSTILSSFIADLDWLFPHFNTRSTTFLLLLHAQNAQHRALLESDFAGLPNVKLVVPEVMGGSGNMHSKVMLLFYQALDGSSAGAGKEPAAATDTSEICRLVIPSANLTRADWGVGGVMENILFVVDLPLKKLDQNDQDNLTIYPFERKLTAQLSAMGVQENVLRKLGRFDFGVTRDVEFVYSRSGSNMLDTGSGTQGTATTKVGAQGFFQKRGKESRGDEERTAGVGRTMDVRSETDDPARTGLLSLQDAVVSLGLDVPVTDLGGLPQVDFITSSLGNLTPQFVRQLYLAICGQLDPAKTIVASKRPNTNTNTKSGDADAALNETVTQNLKIYFPTAETVQRSKGGPDAGGTICFQSKWWDSNELIRKCLHDCVGVRKDGILMHSKILYVRFNAPKAVFDSEGHEKFYAGWAYVGSANLSESAWGRVVSDAKSRQPKLTCRNWESGVLVPVEVKNSMTKIGVLDARGGNRIGCHVGKEDTKEARGLLEGVTSRHGSRFDACKSPTSVKQVAMQIKAGKDDNTTEMEEECGRSMGKDAFDENIMQSAMGATKPPEYGSRDRELLTGGLSKVFSEVVPVPIQNPAPGHVARQQKPWFFME